MTSVVPSFAVAITTLDRRKLFDTTLSAYRKHCPPATPIIVVDDGSMVPVPHTEGIILHRNETPQGIARAKNHCLRLMMALDPPVQHLFLSDDDAYPTASDWWVPYIESGEHHLSLQLTWREYCEKCRTKTNWTYNTVRGNPACDVCKPGQLIHRDDKIHAVEWGSGVLMYFSRHAIETIGGFRPEYGRWSCEHWDIAYRARNAGLIRFPFQDVNAPTKLHSVDATSSVRNRSAIPESIRSQYRERNWQLFEQFKDSKDFVPYLDAGATQRATVAIPWRSAPDRIDAYNRCVGYWQDNGYTVVSADSDSRYPFLCSQARNNAARAVVTDVVILADGDTIPEDIGQISAAVDMVSYGAADVVWPFSEYRHIPMDWALKDDAQLRDAPVQQRYSNSPGGIFVMRTETLWRIGGFDERFTPGALGFDDTAFRLAAETLTRTARVPGIVYSFNHATRPDGTPDRDFGSTHPNRARYLLYKRASGHPTVMRKLVRQ